MGPRCDGARPSRGADVLSFTGAGVVEAPTALQIRMGTRYRGRVRVGAPTPSRRMTDAEVQGNIRWFTEGMRGPRTRPSTRLVLSGVDDDRYRTLPSILRGARQLGIEHVVVHAGHRAPPLVPDEVDVVVMRVPLHTERPTVAGTVCWVLEARQGQGPAVEHAAMGVLRVAGSRLVLTWPYPPAGRPAAPHEVQAMLRRLMPVARQHGSTLHLRGLPSCLVGALDTSPRRARNRWYVDADHQQSGALRFFPDVLRMSKLDACRFCALDDRCDGIADGVLTASRLTLEPLTALVEPL